MNHQRKNSYVDRENMRSHARNRGAQRYGSFSGFTHTNSDRPGRVSRVKADKPSAPKQDQPKYKSSTETPLRHTTTKKQRPVKKSNVLQRSAVRKPHDSSKSPKLPKKLTLPAPKKSVTKTAPRRSRYTLLAAGLLVLFGLTGGLVAYVIETRDPGKARVLSEQSDQQATERPEQIPQEFIDETPRSDVELRNYSVAADQPRLVRIGAIDVEAIVQRVKVDIGNRLITPENIFDIGWYEGSRKPGESGTVLLNGHTSGVKERGALYYARVLEVGDTIELERGDGKKYSYEVRDKQKVPYDEIQTTSLLIPHETGKNGLNIVAVDNRYNVLTDEFQDRLVIYAVEL
ncbi:MAG: sortase [Actinobacteria bacterium]|nr:sortase [Actinomycetota bacterium]